MQLKDKVAVVLGASAKGGTGWATAQRLAEEGAKVVVAARRREPLEALAAEIGGLAVVCDGADGADIARLAHAAHAAYGQIDSAVNCAFQPVVGQIADLSPADLQRSLDVNFIGHVHFVREMAAIMRDGGAITLFSSVASTRAPFGRFAYGCAKAATEALVRYAAAEYGPRGIRVNAIVPGPIKTAGGAHLFDAPGAEAALVREVPLGRVGYPEDFARVVAWLSAPGYITGASLPVSGGMQLMRPPLPDDLVTLNRPVN